MRGNCWSQLGLLSSYSLDAISLFLMWVVNKVLTTVSDPVIEMSLLWEHGHSLLLSDTASEEDPGGKEKARDI